MIESLLVLATVTLTKLVALSYVTHDSTPVHVAFGDTLLTEPMSDTKYINSIEIRLTDTNYGQNSDLHKILKNAPLVKDGKEPTIGLEPTWTLEGIFINGMDSDLLIPLSRSGLTYIDLKLIKNGMPVTDAPWCGTLNFSVLSRFVVMPPLSIHRFSIPVFSEGDYSVGLETKDFFVESNEIEIRF